MSRLSILLVEDSAAQGRFLQQTLRDMEPTTPSDVAWVENLASALEHLQSCKVDLVLLDLILPDSDGIATFVTLHEAYPRVPVIVLSGAGNESTALEAVAAGAQDYLAKRTLSPDLLERALWYAMARSRALAAAEETISAARDQAIEASRLKSQFLANMSHEIRTPMNGVLGFAHLLTDTNLDPTQQGYLDMLRESAETLLSLLNDILDFSKVEAGKLELERIEYDLWATVRSVIALQDATAQGKLLRLEIDIDPAVPQSVVGDPIRLRQILTNLTSNAIKFTDRGSVRVVVRPGEGDRTRFEVIDTGIGIDDSVGQLLDPFAQADASTTRRFGGTGLGLAICRQLVDLMAGDLGYHSKPGQGSTFWFELPLAAGVVVEEEPAAAAEAGPDSDAPAETAHDAGRILLVDDSRVNQCVAKAMLEHLGYQVDVSSNGVEAVAAATALRYDAILMDCLMPEMDGYEATARIRAHEGTELHTPIIAVTASALNGDRQRCIAAGMDDYISKPVYPKTLATVLRRATQVMVESHR